MKKLAKILRRWAERLDPTPTPPPVWPVEQTAQRFRFRRDYDPREWRDLVERFRNHKSEYRLIQEAKEDIIASAALELVKHVQIINSEDRITFEAEIYIK